VIDLTELEALNEVIAASGAIVEQEGAAIVKHGAQNVKTSWRANAAASAGAHARLYPASISYDVVTAPGVVEAEIGPDKGRVQGPLGNILEFGTSTQAGHNDGGQALDDEEPRFLEQIEALAERAAGL
jgi:hypothetical protein